MERLSKAFNDIIEDLGIGKAVTVEILRDRWTEIIGDTVSQHTSPDFFKNGQLIIAVDSPEWLHELKYHQKAVLSKLVPFDIKSIRFKLGKLRRRPRPATRPGKYYSPSEEDRDFAKRTAETVDNESLKISIRKAIERSLGTKRG